MRVIAEKCGVSADWFLGLTNSKKKEAAAVDELKLTDDAVEAISIMDDSVRKVLCVLFEQEVYSGETKYWASKYICRESFLKEPHFHLLQRISDYFCIVGGSQSDSNEYYITDSGDVLDEFDVWEDNGALNFKRLIPIEAGSFIEEALLSDIRSMLMSLKKNYYLKDK